MFYEVILDSGETPNKCTIAPLMDRSDFHVYPVKGQARFGPLKSTVLLHHEGACLTSVIKSGLEVQGIASIDCVWHRLDGLLRRVESPLPLLVRIPDGFETAYPRRSKMDTDPSGGLATIEAIFVAGAILGKWDPTLFSRYYFGREFLELNKDRFLEWGVFQAEKLSDFPPPVAPARNSLQRKRDRGKAN